LAAAQQTNCQSGFAVQSIDRWSKRERRDIEKLLCGRDIGSEDRGIASASLPISDCVDGILGGIDLEIVEDYVPTLGLADGDSCLCRNNAGITDPDILSILKNRRNPNGDTNDETINETILDDDIAAGPLDISGADIERVV